MSGNIVPRCVIILPRCVITAQSVLAIRQRKRINEKCNREAYLFLEFRLLSKSFNYLLRCENCRCKGNVEPRWDINITAYSVFCSYDNIKELLRNVTEELPYFMNFGL